MENWIKLAPRSEGTIQKLLIMQPPVKAEDQARYPVGNVGNIIPSFGGGGDHYVSMSNVANVGNGFPIQLLLL